MNNANAQCLICKRMFTPTRNSEGKYCSQTCYQSAPKFHIPLADRFWPYVTKTTACWIWTGSGDGIDGYGRIKIPTGTRRRQKMIGAHRASWEIHFGPVPGGLQVCHHCDNPSCVKPDHLFLGTNKQNQLDCVQKGRRPHTPNNQGEKHGMSRLTEDAVRDIRLSYSAGERAVVLAKRHGVCVSTIYTVLRGSRWKHVI